jgi:hypothetical protein
MTYQNIALIVLIIGALVYLIAGAARPDHEPYASRIGELGKWSFIIGLAAYFWLVR